MDAKNPLIEPCVYLLGILKIGFAAFCNRNSIFIVSCHLYLADTPVDVQRVDIQALEFAVPCGILIRIAV